MVEAALNRQEYPKNLSHKKERGGKREKIKNKNEPQKKRAIKPVSKPINGMNIINYNS